MSAHDPAPEAARNRRRRADWTVLVPFLLALLGASVVAWRHEMWRDEMQAWLIARDSVFPWDLVRNARYEGHPLLWHLCLWVLSRFSDHPQTMQVLHLAVAAASLWVIARYAPLSLPERVLACLGYFFVYEYAVVARNYALGVLPLLVFCVLYRDRFRRLPAMTLALVLMCQTSVHALMLASGAATVLFADHFLHRRHQAGAVGPRTAALCLAGMLAGMALSAVQMIPPPDANLFSEWYLSFEPARAMERWRVVAMGYAPWPSSGVHFWNTIAYGEHPWFRAHAFALSVLPVLVFTLLLLRRPLVAFFYLASTVGLVFFFYVKFHGELRHHGFLYLALFAASWISLADPRAPEDPRRARLDRGLLRVHRALFVAVLALQAGAGLKALWLDWRYPFSGGEEVARFLVRSGLEHATIVTENAPQASTVLGYAAIPTVFHARAGRPSSFVVWDADWNRPLSRDALVDVALEQRHEHDGPVILLSSQALRAPSLQAHGIRELLHTGPAASDEPYWVYLLPAAREPEASGH